MHKLLCWHAAVSATFRSTTYPGLTQNNAVCYYKLALRALEHAVPGSATQRRYTCPRSCTSCSSLTRAAAVAATPPACSTPSRGSAAAAAAVVHPTAATSMVLRVVVVARVAAASCRTACCCCRCCCLGLLVLHLPEQLPLLFQDFSIQLVPVLLLAWHGSTTTSMAAFS